MKFSIPSSSSAAVILLSSSALLADPANAGTVQLPGLTLPSTAAADRAFIKAIFSEAYGAYRQYAFGHDDLSPISKSFSDGRNGWGATIADALGTLQIMGFTDWYNEGVQHFANIDFTKSYTKDTVSIFETTIRYIGGFLSAYQLNGEKDAILITKAKQIADKLVYGYQGSAIPYGHINFTGNVVQRATSNIAEAGTLSLEWQLLSQYTQNTTYGRLATGSATRIASLADPLPGLAPQCINPANGQFCDSYITWSGGSDSYFEYLIKYPRLFNSDPGNYAKTWATAVDSSIKYLMRKSTVGNWTYLAERDDSGRIVHTSSHLACFHGGNWILGGKLMNNATIVNYGLQLVDACINTYTSTATGIGPEAFAFISSDGSYNGGSKPSSSQTAFYNQHGFYITASDYILRPEVLESNFYAWRATGNVKYYNNAKTAAAALNKALNVTTGYAGTNDVNNVKSSLIDDMESFFFAEVMKYLYLTFDDPSHISLDEWVFNTECHPFKAPAAKSSYSAGAIFGPSSQSFSPTPADIPAAAVSDYPLIPDLGQIIKGQQTYLPGGNQ